MLQFTRRKILEREFVVEMCAQISALDAILAKGRIDIAVLCHSVPDAECQEVMHRLREHSPAVKVLVLYETMPEICSSHSDESMENLEGPSSLLHKLHELMDEAAHDKARQQ
jgi:DNA-binding NtrC family response regulator